MQTKPKLSILVTAICLTILLASTSVASELDQQLSTTGLPYIKYFSDNAIQTTDFKGLTRSFQLYLGGHTPADEAVINYGAISYDQSILARIGLAGNTKTILDTYLSYATTQKLSDINNPLLNCNGNYYGSGGPTDKILYGPYRAIRISGRTIPNWYTTWDWTVDTGAAACLIIDALEAYQKTSTIDYKNFAVLLGGYLLKLQDSDGGIRYGPRGIYHPQGTDFFWNLKSTEQNERCLFAFQALYSVTANSQYNTAASNIKNWLKSMYDFTAHLYHCSAQYDGSSWIKSDIYGYVVTDVPAFAPLDVMFSDTYFGATQTARDAEVDAMFEAIESRTAFLNASSIPTFYRFSVSQIPDPVKGDYGSVEWSAQMAMQYLRAAQNYSTRDLSRAQAYLDKYNTLITSLDTFFSAPSGDANSKVSPYASFNEDKSVAGNVPTGTGYYTYNCQAALASAYYAFAKSGYDPTRLGGGTGIPNFLNLTGVPWYQNTSPYSSTGATTAQMILNYIRSGAGASTLTQDQIYIYAKSPQPYGTDLTAAEVDKALGHFDPYDSLVSNWADSYDSLSGGNPYQGYNFDVETFDPNSDLDAINKYMRDICHWMAYTVTREDWWSNGTLVACPNTPSAIPIYGSYNHWVVVKGYAASTNPCPQPHTNPWNTPSFTVYGFWIKDPLISGIGQDTYKTAAECTSTYFLPLVSTDSYNGKFLQVAEPPLYISRAAAKFNQPTEDTANLSFIGVKAASLSGLTAASTKSLASFAKSAPTVKIEKQNWKDIVDPHLLSDASAQSAFDSTAMGSALSVKRLDANNTAYYYLVPFNKTTTKNKGLTSAVVILDAAQGYFKEASWTATPQKFLKVNQITALSLVKNYIAKSAMEKISKLTTKPYKTYYARRNAILRAYYKLISYLYHAQSELQWSSANGYSSSPYNPYWKIGAYGYNWYVTQEGKVIAETSLDKIFNGIQ